VHQCRRGRRGCWSRAHDLLEWEVGLCWWWRMHECASGGCGCVDGAHFMDGERVTA